MGLSEETSTSTLGLKVVSYEIPAGAFQTEWQRKAYEVFLMQLALKAEKGPGHEGFFDATSPPISRRKLLKPATHLETRSCSRRFSSWNLGRRSIYIGCSEIGEDGAQGATRKKMVKTLKEQKELGEPTRKRSKQAERRRLFGGKLF
ncbi:unnamed protein product [Caenorhabditis nigoni]